MNEWLQKILEDNLEKILRIIFFWEKDDKRIGISIRFIHHFIVYTTFISYIILHIIPSHYILFLILYIMIFLMWLQHCIYGGCIFSTIESKLIGDNYSMWDSILDMFHITVTSDSINGFYILASSISLFVITCEMIEKTVAIIINHMQ